MALFGTSCYEHRSVLDEFSGLMCVSKSDTTQKLERQRVDGSEQRLHRSVGQLVLAKPAQHQIHTRPSKPRVSRSPWSGTRGRRNSIADLSEVRYTETRYRSVQPRKILGQLYPTRQKGVWPQLLRLKDVATANFTLATLEIDDVSRRET